MKKQISNDQSGYTLIALLVFILVAMTITTSAAVMSAISMRSNTSIVLGSQALTNAESGVYMAMQSILRNPTYTGSTVTLPEGTATITVSGTTTRTIISQGADGSYRRTLTVTATLTGNAWAITSWRETP